MTLQNDNTTWFDVLSDLCSLHQIRVINRRVEGIAILQLIKPTIKQVPIDSIGTVEIIVAIGLFNLEVDLRFIFGDAARISPRSPSQITTNWIVEVNQTQNTCIG
jgi:hypothetical protein